MAVKLVTLAHCSEQLGKSEQSLRWMRYKDTGPKSALIGGRVMYRQQDIDDWINAQFETATKESA